MTIRPKPGAGVGPYVPTCAMSSSGLWQPGHNWCMVEAMTTNERLEEQSFCYDPDFPPDVAEGLPLTAAVAANAEPGAPSDAPISRALRAAAALAKRGRS
jgi:hypothetical protein